jgi:uncharacterized protein YegJ (DUF2314 family)
MCRCFIFASHNPYMKSKIILLFIIISCYSCATKSQTTDTSDPVINIQDDDAKMNEAIKKASQSFKVFEAAFNSKKKTYSYFTIKIPFAVTGGHEHIWISDISKEKDGYFGIVDNLPESATTVKQGDKIKIETEKLSDWMFVEDGKLRGGYTFRVLLKRMTPEERKEFESGLPFIIEEEKQ